MSDATVRSNQSVKSHLLAGVDCCCYNLFVFCFIGSCKHLGRRSGCCLLFPFSCCKAACLPSTVFSGQSARRICLFILELTSFCDFRNFFIASRTENLQVASLSASAKIFSSCRCVIFQPSVLSRSPQTEAIHVECWMSFQKLDQVYFRAFYGLVHILDSSIFYQCIFCACTTITVTLFNICRSCFFSIWYRSRPQS